MEMDMKAMKAELGGAFMVSWVVFGLGLGTIEGSVALAVAWLAFGGAHILPVVTWCHMITGDLADTEGNWMANGMRLVAQVVGATLAVLLVTELGTVGPEFAYGDMWIPDIADNAWGVLGMVAAGAVWWQVHTRADSAWISAFGLMALGGAMTLTGGHMMGASLADGGSGIVDVLADWVCDGLFVGIGAFVGCKIDDAI